MSTHTFEGTIEAGRGGGAFVPVPLDVEAVFGTRGQVRVVATFDGEADRTSMAPMGGRHVLGLRKSVREKLGKGPGDPVSVTLERDDAERTIEMPPELVEALAQEPEASTFFDSLSYTHRKELAHGIRDAKKPETRQRRLDRAMALLRDRRKP